MKPEEIPHPELAGLSFSALGQGATNSTQGTKLHPGPFQTAHMTVTCMRWPPWLSLGIPHTADPQTT